MKIVIFIYSMSSGGAERVTANIANNWVTKGVDVIILTIASQKLDFYVLHPAVSRISLELSSESSNFLAAISMNLQRVLSLRQVLCKIKPDVVIGMMATANVLLALASLGLRGIHTIGAERIHPPNLPLGTLWEKLRRLTYCHLDAVTALTSKSADWIKSYTNARYVTMIPNAATWPLPQQPPQIFPDSMCHKDRHILLTVGRLDVQKGFDLLLKSFSQLVKQHPDWDLVILGEGPQRMALESQIHECGLDKRVVMPGRVGNVGQWYERADLYVMSSRFEGFPNTLAEAMAHCLPAVSFDCDTGPRDIIRHKVDGLLVPPEDVDGLTEALDGMMRDADQRQRFAARAIDARRRFSTEKITSMWDELIALVLSKHQEH